MCLKLICVGVSAGFIHVHTEPWPFTETQLVDTAKTFHFSQSRCWIGEKNSESEKKSLWVLLHHKALVVISKASPPAFICERRGSEQQSETHEAIRGFWSAEYLMRNVNEPIRHSVRMSCILSVDWFYLFFFKLNHWVFLLFILMTNFVGFSSACQDGPIVRWERRCRKPKHKTRGAPVPALCLVCWQSDYEPLCLCVDSVHWLIAQERPSLAEREKERERRWRWRWKPQRDASHTLGDC